MARLGSEEATQRPPETCEQTQIEAWTLVDVTLAGTLLVDITLAGTSIQFPRGGLLTSGC